MNKETFYAKVVVTFRNGEVVTFESVKRSTIQIDDNDYLMFDRLTKDLGTWCSVTIDMDDNVLYYEVTPEN